MRQLFHIQIGADWHGQRRVPEKHPKKPDGSRDISLDIGERDTNKTQIIVYIYLGQKVGVEKVAQHGNNVARNL